MYNLENHDPENHRNIEHEQIIAKIFSAVDLSSTLGKLEKDEQASFYEMIKTDLSWLIKSEWDFTIVLEELKDEAQRIAFYNEIKGQLPVLIKSLWDFLTISNALPPELYADFFATMKYKLPELITSTFDLELVLGQPKPEQRIAFYNEMKGELPVLIKSLWDFLTISNALPPELSADFFATMKAKLPKLITSLLDFSTVLTYLNHEQYAAFFETMEDALPNLIKSPRDFSNALQYLGIDKYRRVCEEMAKPLSIVNYSISDFRSVLQHLSNDRCAVFFDIMKDKLIPTVKSVKDFCDIFSYLPYLRERQKTELYEKMKYQLPQLNDIEKKLAHIGLNDTQQAELEKIIALVKELKTKNPSIDTIKSVVNQHGLLLPYVEGLLQADIDVAKTAYAQNRHVLPLISTTLLSYLEGEFTWPEKGTSDYKKLQAICFLERYLTISRKEQLLPLRPSRRWNFFSSQPAYTSRTKREAAEKAIQCLNSTGDVDHFSPAEWRALNEGPLKTIIKPVKELLASSSPSSKNSRQMVA